MGDSEFVNQQNSGSRHQKIGKVGECPGIPTDVNAS